MSQDALIVLLVIAGAVVLFITEWLTVDLVAMLAVVALVLTGVITPREGVAGFSNPATLTVLFMFVLSAAVLRTGILQYAGPKLSGVFRQNFLLGTVLMMLSVAVVSAFINNTPVVAVLIPVVVQIGHNSGHSPAKLLIPLSYASIFGGMCSLLGTSTNILVSGIAEDYGLEGFSMFQMSPMGLILLTVGILYMIFFGLKRLPGGRGGPVQEIGAEFQMRDYLTEIQLMDNADSIGKKIMDSPLVRELDMDILEIRRGPSKFTLPPGDMVLESGDLLKVRCNVEKIRQLKDRVRINPSSPIRIAEENFLGKNTSLVELVITANSPFEGKTLRQVDFRRQFRAAPLAIRHREEVVYEQLHDCQLKAGDVILTEIKSHYLEELKRSEGEQGSPFIILSEKGIEDFNRRQFFQVLAVIAAVVGLATAGLVPIMVGALGGVCALVLTKNLTMKEAYRSVSWKVIFLLAGAVSIGTAMQKSGLAEQIAEVLTQNLEPLGPHAIIAGLYLLTSVLTEIMSNNATAALLAPIAIAMAQSLGMDPTPFLMAIMFAASASFMTPVGYQTNTMIYSAGQYKYLDFFRVGVWLNLSFWLLATLLIPIIFGM